MTHVPAPDRYTAMSSAGVAMDEGQVATLLEAVDRSSGRFLLGITGPPGAGKSTTAALIEAAANEQRRGDFAVVAPMDGFHLSNNKLAECGLLGVKGAPETFDVNGFVRAVERMRADPALDDSLAGIRPLDRANGARRDRDPPVGEAGRRRRQLPPPRTTRLARPAQVLRRDLVRRRATARPADTAARAGKGGWAKRGGSDGSRRRKRSPECTAGGYHQEDRRQAARRRCTNGGLNGFGRMPMLHRGIGAGVSAAFVRAGST